MLGKSPRIFHAIGALSKNPPKITSQMYLWAKAHKTFVFIRPLGKNSQIPYPINLSHENLLKSFISSWTSKKKKPTHTTYPKGL